MMEATPLPLILARLGTTLSASLVLLVAGALMALLMAQVLLDAYHSPASVSYSRRVRLSTVVLLVAFGFGMLLRILQIQGLPGK